MYSIQVKQIQEGHLEDKIIKRKYTHNKMKHVWCQCWQSVNCTCGVMKDKAFLLVNISHPCFLHPQWPLFFYELRSCKCIHAKWLPGSLTLHPGCLPGHSLSWFLLRLLTHTHIRNCTWHFPFIISQIHVLQNLRMLIHFPSLCSLFHFRYSTLFQMNNILLPDWVQLWPTHFISCHYLSCL